MMIFDISEMVKFAYFNFFGVFRRLQSFDECAPLQMNSKNDLSLSLPN